jgi:hypothetical protein
MKYIHTFESFINEGDEAPENGTAKTITSALGAKMGRLVVSGSDVEKKKQDILNIIAKADPSAKVNYFDATKKIVGTFAVAKLKVIDKELKNAKISVVTEIKNPTLK